MSCVVFSVNDIKVLNLQLERQDSSIVALLVDILIACLCCEYNSYQGNVFWWSRGLAPQFVPSTVFAETV